MIFIIGLGPGGENEMTSRAVDAPSRSDVIVGYKAYLDLLVSRFGHKRLIPSAIKQEVERCRQTAELALAGNNVALVSGGDAGVLS